MNTKQVTHYYDTIPTVPQDFDGAVAVHKQALDAIHYWSVERQMRHFQIDKDNARNMYNRWQRVKEAAAKVIASYQLPLF